MLELGLLLAGGYAAASGGLWLMQDRLLFPRAATPPPERTLPPRAERVSLTAADGSVLHGVHVPAARAQAPLVIGFAGNAWNAQDYGLFLQECLPETALVAFHYRGYAPSQGRPSEQALLADAVLIHDALAARWPGRAIVAVGASLGSAVAAHLVAERRLRGAVLITPFDSIRAVAREQYPWAPVGPLLRHPFDSAARLRTVDRPVAILTAAEDRLIRAARSRALLEAAANVVHHHDFAGVGHETIYDHPAFADELASAVAALLDRRRVLATADQEEI